MQLTRENARVGMKVRVVSTPTSEIPIGSIVTVVDYGKLADMIDIKNSAGEVFKGFYYHRFELIEEKEETPMVKKIMIEEEPKFKPFKLEILVDSEKARARLFDFFKFVDDNSTFLDKRKLAQDLMKELS